MNKIKKGDVLLYIGKGFFGKLVALISFGKYYHCAICVEDDKVICIDQSGATFKDIDLTKIDIDFDVWRPEYRIKKNKDETIKFAVNSAKQITAYGFTNLLALIISPILKLFNCDWFENKHYMICSEHVACCLDAGKVVRVNKYYNSLLSPNDISKTYEGNFLK